MLLTDILAALLVLCIPSALITAYIAHMYNRSLWRWLLFGFLVPFVAIFVAIGLAMRDARREEAAGKLEDKETGA